MRSKTSPIRKWVIRQGTNHVGEYEVARNKTLQNIYGESIYYNPFYKQGLIFQCDECEYQNTS